MYDCVSVGERIYLESTLMGLGCAEEVNITGTYEGGNCPLDSSICWRGREAGDPVGHQHSIAPLKKHTKP